MTMIMLTHTENSTTSGTPNISSFGIFLRLADWIHATNTDTPSNVIMYLSPYLRFDYGMNYLPFDDTMIRSLQNRTLKIIQHKMRDLPIMSEAHTRADILEIGKDERSQNYNAVVSRCRDLLWEEADEDAGIHPATSHAFEGAVRLLSETVLQMHETFPRASTSTDEKGSINLYWTKPGRNVVAIVPSSVGDLATVFYRDGNDYDLEKHESISTLASTLARWLDWLAAT
jgi:hypothetical protein